MSRLVNRPVATGPADGSEEPPWEKTPRWFIWRGRRLEVEAVMDEWLDTGRWWQGEAEKRFVRVVAKHGSVRGTYELYCDRATGKWHLYRILD